MISSRPSCKNADADLRLTVIFSHKSCNLHEKLSMLLVPSQQFNAGEVLRTTPASSLCISAAKNNLLEGKVVGINWYGYSTVAKYSRETSRCISGLFRAHVFSWRGAFYRGM